MKLKYILEQMDSNTNSDIHLVNEEPSPLLLKQADNDPEFKGFDMIMGREHISIMLGKECIGFLTPRKDPANYWRTGAIYIKPEYRSKGYANKAIKIFISKHKPARSWISDKNISSIKSFTNAGFKRGEKYDLDDGEEGYFYIYE